MRMDADEFYEYISKLWSMLIWGNKKYVVDKLINDNGFSNIKKELAECLYGSSGIEKRWNTCLKRVKGLGPSTISELLSYANPQECVVFNKTTIQCLTYLEIEGMPRYNYQYTGKKYLEVCGIARSIAEELTACGVDNVDLLTVDFFLWDEVLPLTEAREEDGTAQVTPAMDAGSSEHSLSIHDEIKDKLVAIGELLGFESRSEVYIATGAKVDAVWEAKIGNMGKAIMCLKCSRMGQLTASS